MNRKLIAIGVVIILAVLAMGLFIHKTITTNAIKENPDLEEWLYDNCNCTERNNWKCFEGFVLEPELKLCRNGTEYSHVILGCSKYECDGEIYTLTDGKWKKEELPNLDLKNA